MNLSIKQVDNHIEVKFKLTYSPNMYIYEQEGLYYMCVNHQTLIDADFPEDKLKRVYNIFSDDLKITQEYFVEKQ